MNSASVSWSIALLLRSASALAATTSSIRSRGEDEPAEPQAGRERLARGSGVDDPLRGQRLQRAERVPVVAELAVVVVLDDQPAGARAPTRPRSPRRRAPAARRAGTGGPASAARRRPIASRSTAAPSSSTSSGASLSPHALRGARRWPAGCSARSRASLAPRARSASQSSRNPCVKPEQTTTRSGVTATPRARATYSASAARSSGRPRGSRVAERPGGRRASARRAAAEPGRARESRHVGRARAAGRTGSGASAARARRRRPARSRAGRSATHVPEPCMAVEPALGDELAVGLGDRVPREAEVGGERPRGRQRGPGRQPAARTASRSADSSAALGRVPVRSRCRSTPEMAHVFCHRNGS